jgi:hypothetical protein
MNPKRRFPPRPQGSTVSVPPAPSGAAVRAFDAARVEGVLAKRTRAMEATSILAKRTRAMGRGVRLAKRTRNSLKCLVAFPVRLSG